MIYNLLSGEGTGTSSTGTIIIMIVLIVAIIGLFIWQSITGKKKQQEAQNMVDSLKVGDGVKTIGGICGVVAEINNQENTFVLETGTDNNKAFIKFDKGAIYQTYSKIANEEAKQTVPAKEEKPVEAEEVKAEEPAPVAEETKTEENN